MSMYWLSSCIEVCKDRNDPVKTKWHPLFHLITIMIESIVNKKEETRLWFWQDDKSLQPGSLMPLKATINV